MKDKTIVITGIGAVTPLDKGKGVDVFWQRLCRGDDGLGPIRSIDVNGFECQIGGEICGFEKRLNGMVLDDCSRAVKLFALAVKQAKEDAGIMENMGKVGICCGSVLGSIDLEENYLEKAFFTDRKKDLRLLKGTSIQVIPSFAAEMFDFKGPNFSVNTACSSSGDAVILSANEIRNGRADIMIAGGVEIFSEFLFRGFSAIGALTKDGKVRPFDKNRTGLAVSEGAGVLVLEEKEHALARNAEIYCTLAGGSSTVDAYNLVRPHVEGQGLSKAIMEAINSAGAQPRDIDYISAHGTGTYHNDLAETKAIKRAFGKEAKSVKISAIKSMIGHTMGASAVLGAISCVRAIKDNIIPPTINYKTPDVECDLNYVTGGFCATKVNTAMVLAAGFGGQNSTLIFKEE